MKCFLDRTSSYFSHPEYTERFRGRGRVAVCTFGRSEQGYGERVNKAMKVTVEGLHGIYLGDVCASAYQKGRVREIPEVLQACHFL